MTLRLHRSLWEVRALIAVETLCHDHHLPSTMLAFHSTVIVIAVAGLSRNDCQEHINCASYMVAADQPLQCFALVLFGSSATSRGAQSCLTL
jgi:hypothetical protein